MAKAGDIVRIETETETYEGILMPRPEMLDGFTVVKLDNGYNIGIDNSKIKTTTVKEKYTPKKEKPKKIPHKKGLPNVSILSTGGTIASRIDYRTGGVYADYTAEDFIQLCPEIANFANLKAGKVMNIMSEDIHPSHWMEMAKAVEKEFEAGAEGIVITHGTDTLHYTAAALSFLIKEHKRPIVLTAAQRSIDRGSSDAFMNLTCAVAAAAKFDGAGVMTCMHGTSSDDYCLLIRGTKVRKMHTSKRDAFRPVNDLPLAKIFPGGMIETINKDYPKRQKGAVAIHHNWDDRVALMTVYPGMDPKIIDFYLNEGYKGIVLAATALGHIPTEGKHSLLPNMRKAIDKGMHFIIASQTLYGRTHPYVYTNLRKLSVDTGCIFAEDMLPETAYVKLQWVLGHETSREKVKWLFEKNIAGEYSTRSLPDTFLY